MIWEKMIARRRIMGKSEFPEEQPLPVKLVRTESPPQALRIPLSGRTPRPPYFDRSQKMKRVSKFLSCHLLV